MSAQFVAALLMLMNAARADVHAPAFREDPTLSARAHSSRLSVGTRPKPFSTWEMNV